MKFESFHFSSYFFVIFFISWYLFSFALFANIDFFLQLVSTLVRRLHDDVCNFEREKTMLAIQVFISRCYQYGDILTMDKNKTSYNITRI
jgi:hypothetical protein